MGFRKIRPQDLERNTFSLIGSDWLLLTAGDGSGFNTMTVSWGGLGVLWKKNVATVYVRPQRYTFGFMEKGEYFTLSSYPESMRDKLAICGSKSGRDIDKVQVCGLTPRTADCGAVYFDEADTVLVCRKMYWDDIEPARFLAPEIGENYELKDYHRMYIAEIVEVLKK